jgi:hypothetical protein
MEIRVDHKRSRFVWFPYGGFEKMGYRDRFSKILVFFSDGGYVLAAHNQ